MRRSHRESSMSTRPAGAGSSRGALVALQIQRDGLTDEVLQCAFVDLVMFLDVDGAPDLPLEARVEETRRIVQRSTLEERQLDHVLVGLTGADPPVVGPDRRSGA